MADLSWDKFTIRIPVNAPLEELYNAWATRNGIERWFLRESLYKNTEGKLRNKNEQVQNGDSYAWLWFGWPDDMVEQGTILECNRKDLFKFSFGNAGNCTVKIYTEQEQNIVELLQESMPETEEGKHYWHIGCKTGWTFYFTNMKSVFEGGIDLRNKNENLKQVINA